MLRKEIIFNLSEYLDLSIKALSCNDENISPDCLSFDALSDLIDTLRHLKTKSQNPQNSNSISKQ